MVRFVSVCALLLVVIAFATASSASVFFKDDWNDNTVLNPTLAPSNVNWTVESGSFSANSASPPSGFFNPMSGVLMFGPNNLARISVNFGQSVVNSPIEVRFKLRQTSGSSGSYLFKFGLKNTATGYSYLEDASPNVNFFGVAPNSSGFDTMIFTGSGPNDWTCGCGTAGKCLSTSASEWNYIKFRFDPAIGIEVWQAKSTDKTKAYNDPSLAYYMVASWNNYWNIKSFDQFFLDNVYYTLSWMVDDVEIDGAGLFVKDDLSDQVIDRPTQTPADMDWKVDRGSVSANASAPPSGFINPVSQALMFSPSTGSGVSVQFGMSAVNSTLEARFRLRQTSGSSSNYRFGFGFANTITGYSYGCYGVPNTTYYSTSGFSALYPTGYAPVDWTVIAGTAGKCLSSSANNWNFIKLRFNPSTGIEVWQAIDTNKNKAYNDASLVYSKVSSWNNFWNVKSFDKFFLDNTDASISWMVDDIEVDNNGIIFKDDWTDKIVQVPTSSPNWTVESGSFSANSTSPPSGFLNPMSQTMMFGPQSQSRISIDFGENVANTSLEARFKLRQTDASGSHYLFKFGFKNTITGYSYMEYACPNNQHFGTYPNSSGFDSMVFTGSGPNDWTYGCGTYGTALTTSSANWNYIKFRFDPAVGVEVWQAVSSNKTKAYNDPTLSYTMVTSWSNYWNIKSFDQFFLDNCNYTLSWMVDDIEIVGERWAKKGSATQTVYQSFAPHTDKNGSILTSYQSGLSFLPIGLYHEHPDVVSFADLGASDFNCCHLRDGYRPTSAVADAAYAAGIQLITHWPSDTETIALRYHPATLGWYLTEEPTGNPDVSTLYSDYQARRTQIRALDSNHPIFPLDNSWIISPVTSWWVTWNISGDISAHDNYPIDGKRTTLSYGCGIPESISLAVAANNQSKPVWFCAQAHYFDNPTYFCEFPTSAQERCMIYTAVIHGATGVLYFGLDSFVLRAGNCIGIAPNPQADYGGGYLVATAEQVSKSLALWNAVASLNGELNTLRPSILSSTANVAYEVYADGRTSETNNPIRTLLKVNPSGGYILLLSNIDATPQQVRVRFPSNFTFTVSDVFNAQATVIRSADEFVVSCPGYDARAFSINL